MNDTFIQQPLRRIRTSFAASFRDYSQVLRRFSTVTATAPEPLEEEVDVTSEVSLERLAFDRRYEIRIANPLDESANLRSMFAWTRLSVSIIALGLAITRFSQRLALAIGVVVSSGGFAILILTTMRYFQVGNHLKQGEFLTNNFFISVVLLVVSVVSITTAALVATPVL